MKTSYAPPLNRLALLAVAVLASLFGPISAPARDGVIKVRTVERPPAALNAGNRHYVGNRAPLEPSPFYKLPIGAIQPKGWLRHQLELEAAGMIGRLEEISRWCNLERSAWASADGLGDYGWEEMPYWLKGYGDLGYVLGDPKITARARQWIEGVLSSQSESGYFGPRANQTSLQGKPDLWPHMVMCNVLESFYEHTGDGRVIPFLTRYFKWLNTQPPEYFGLGYWPKLRFGDNIQSVYWLYNHTGEAWLLELATKIHQNMARWDTGVIDWHNVNIAQGFRAPAVYFQQARDARLLAAAEGNYRTVMGLYGQFPGGGFAGDENCRKGYDDPRQGFETCGIVEFMHSFEMLTKISGNPLWADRCEELAFNSLPAALTADATGLHYLTCANQVQLDKGNKAPGIQNGGTMFSYSPFEVYRCCQHNVSHGWPYYAEELWLATPDGGLCASLYAASEVTAKVADGAVVKIIEETDYPFGDTIQLRFETTRPAWFPLYLRIPKWCEAASIRVNGKRVALKPEPLSYAVIERAWAAGDTLTLKLPMKISVRRWAANKNAASVDYGPLTFSLKIGERWSRYGSHAEWPEWEVFPTTPFNYGLVLNERSPAKSFKLVKRSGPLAAQPFTPETAPLEIRAKARRIPAWQQDANGLLEVLQPSPVRSTEPVETVTLIPMGAARLRIASFPVIGQGRDARVWEAPQLPPVRASHCHAGDTVAAAVDGREPASSSDASIPRFTWWDHRGTEEWIEYDFGEKRRLSSVQVYWFDDTGIGACRVPAGWTVQYREGETWKEVAGATPYGVERDQYNRVTFDPVETTGVRLSVRLQPNYSAGILEWKFGR